MIKLKCSSTPAIGLLGGTFDPVHIGHLRAAVECANTLHLSEIRLMPCNPVHRGLPQASNTDRKKMLDLAVQNSRILTVESYELGQQLPTYTIDTLRYIRHQIGYDVPLYFITGADAFNQIETWKEWHLLFAEANFVVMQRPGVELAVNNDEIRGKLSSFDGIHNNCGSIYPVKVSALDVSSTKIRQLIQQQLSIEFLLPKSVELYIQQQGLYQ